MVPNVYEQMIEAESEISTYDVFLQENGDVFTLQAGEDKWLKSYIEKFPLFESEIRCFLETMKLIRHPQIRLFFQLNACYLPEKARRCLQRLLCPLYFQLSSVTVLDMLKQCGIYDEELVKHLTFQKGDYAGETNEVSFLIHAMTILHYIDGGLYYTSKVVATN